MGEAIGGYLRTPQVAKLAGVPARTIRWWRQIGLIPASTGVGQWGKYDFRQTVRALALARLRQAGVSVQTWRRAAEILEREWGQRDPLADAALLVIDGALFFAPTPGELWHVLKSQRAIREVFVLDVGELARRAAQEVLPQAA